MVERFEELGIATEVAAGAERMGWRAPTGLQAAAIPVIRRGNNVMLHASTGAGVTGAYGLGILDRLAGEPAADSPRVLVLTPDSDDASSVADQLARLAAPAAIEVRAASAGWPERPAHILVTAVAEAVAALRASALKLDGVVSLVLVAADRLLDLEGGSSLETVLEAVPASAQRVVVAGRLDQQIEDLVERHARRALTIPSRPADEEAEAWEPTATVHFVVIPEAGKASAAAHLLSGVTGGETAVVCRSIDRAARIAPSLAGRGVAVQGEGPDSPDARVRVLPWQDADQRSTRADVLSYDVPFDAESLAALHGRGGSVLVTPRELAHLRLTARRARVKLKPVKLPESGGMDAATALRERLRSAIREVDLAAELALIEPLLADISAIEVAAAAVHLARTTRPAPEAQGARAGEGAEGARATGGASRPGAGAPPPPTTWTRLFVSAGTRDGVGPGDLVGAIAGDAGIPGDQVGKIEVRESHSTVEVPAALAATVIQALNGRSMRGRSLRVDYDRKDRPQGRGSAAGAGDRSTGGRTGAPRGGADRRTSRGAGGSAPPGRGPGRGSPGRGSRGGGSPDRGSRGGGSSS